MNCPKCGFAQEERADCRKCGVVFAKFHALVAQESVAPLENPEPPRLPKGINEEHNPPESAALIELRQSLRDLQRRFNELEFERAERRRIRGEIRALDERLQEALGQTTAFRQKLEQHAAKLDTLSPGPTHSDIAELRMEVRTIGIESVQSRMERIEIRLQDYARELSAKPDARLLEVLPMMNERLDEVERRMSTLAEAKGAASGNGEAARLDAALKEVEELKFALQNVTIRYTEIGELKKNHLVLRDMIESLQQTTESFRKAPANGNSGRVPELDKEVSALKAEVRKAYERLESLEVQGLQVIRPTEAAPIEEIVTLKEEFAASGRLHAEERQQMQCRLSTLEAKINENLQILANLPGNLEWFASQIHRVDQQQQTLAETLEKMSSMVHEVPQSVADLNSEVAAVREELRQKRSHTQAVDEKAGSLPVGPPQETTAFRQRETYSIQENLDEIRRFMADLSRNRSK